MTYGLKVNSESINMDSLYLSSLKEENKINIPIKWIWKLMYFNFFYIIIFIKLFFKKYNKYKINNLL